MERVARRSEAFGRSPWTFIDQYLDRHPDLIYFGNGAPAPELYPVERLREGSRAAWDDIDAEVLDYGELKGYRPLREYIADRMNRRGISISAEGILLTFGSQQGIDIAARLMLDPGDVLAAEGPTYIGALQAFDAYEPSYCLCPVDDEGLPVDNLAAHTLRTGQAPKIIYVIPNFQNPTGQTMSLRRRQELIAFAREHGSLIVEDDPYGELWYDQAPPASLRALDDGVAYLGTFSKTIAPGLRVGWMAIPDELMGRALMAKEASEIVGVRSVTRVVHAAAEGFLNDHVEEARVFYAARRDALMSALDEAMPDGVKWTTPGGGFFAWVTLPEPMLASDLLPVAAEHGVGFLPGRFFYPCAEGDDRSLRLSFSTMPEDRLRIGIGRLGAAISQQMQSAK
jgi:2-aminoadipate transaminase